MRRLFGLVLAVACCNAWADCSSTLPLEGVVSIKGCDRQTQQCVAAAEALHNYASKSDDQPDVLSIALQSSPWRLYDQDMRILSVGEMAAFARPLIKDDVKRVELVASWSAVTPDSKSKSLAKQVSDSLNGFPVKGLDGFLWVDKEGKPHTTRQAFTMGNVSGPYFVVEGSDVMASLVVGWYATMEGEFQEKKDAEGVMRAGAGWDIFFLCPDRALQAFERAAKLSHPIAAYNAAVMRLDRGQKGDVQQAKALLTQAAKFGDAKSQRLLEKLR